ncbi:MAG: D-alanine--D-alanine ligase [Phycisphaerae bacterium]|nr:D-alanine--D-alanine ligase [Phycisphaerae bacterium]
MTDHLDITVLMGGPSFEHDVSLMSGENVAAGLEAAGHRVTRADICPTNTTALDRNGIDVVFIALHGEFGESGEVQQLCEDRGLRYIGSCPRASMLGMDKPASKQLFRRSGLSTPDWTVIENFQHLEESQPLIEKIPVPVVVKPIGGGSSVDTIIVRDEASRVAAVSNLLDTYDRCMIEKFVAGRELTVGILGDEPLPIIEIVTPHTFYDYSAKYEDGSGTEFIFPDDLDSSMMQQIYNDAITAHEAINARDISRVDFILDADGVLQVLEINTIPGFTTHSLVPLAASRAGIDMPALADRIVKMAMERDVTH